VPHKTKTCSLAAADRRSVAGRAPRLAQLSSRSMLTHPRNNFDLIRLLAALQVLFNHAVGWLALPNLPYPYSSIVSAFPGVPIFFVVSGFLIARSFLDCQGNVIAFGWRRALRIYPGL